MRGPEAGGGAGQPRLGTVLTGLCVTEIVSWGVLYYAFPVLAPSIRAQTGWSPSLTTAAFSGALVVAAVVGIPVGRLLDRHGPRVIMTLGSVIAVLACAVIAWSPNLVIFALGWLLAGVAMAGVLYQAAFAALTRWYGTRRLRALTAVTLVAGLASTVFAPLTEALNSLLGWRAAFAILAVGLAVITIPVHAIVLRRRWPADRQPTPHVELGIDDHVRSVLGSRQFWFLTVGLTVASLAIFAVVINLVALLTERGMSSALAAWTLGLGGVGQVAGRLFYPALARRLGVRSRTLIIFGLAAVSTAALALVPGPVGALIAIAMIAGVARGIGTLLQATAVPDRWGALAYGRISGVLAAPVTIASALAPWIGATLAVLVGGYPAMFGILAVLATGAVILLAFSVPRR
ncbi:MFS transporter [Microlunatus parietis]|uniref:MFS family permease n=1 Tax=Microlunatus parietis TaxID=682979 RepID=A0A7Y9LAK7_9ACTN|nr:MFS transporter [Microlunatus parietis]NYE72944.1 MFS family permease [Microlunatus parietis]